MRKLTSDSDFSNNFMEIHKKSVQKKVRNVWLYQEIDVFLHRIIN